MIIRRYKIYLQTRQIAIWILIAALLLTVITMKFGSQENTHTLKMPIDRIGVDPNLNIDYDIEEVEEPIDQIVLPPQGTEGSPSCSCQQVDLPMKETYDQDLNLVIPWLGISNREHLKKHHPNFPLSITHNMSVSRCRLMPSPVRIRWTNTYYQKVIMEKGEPYHLYSAHMDNRYTTALRPCVRILAYTTERTPQRPWCYFWFNVTGPPAVSRVSTAEIINDKFPYKGYPTVVLLTCKINTNGPLVKPKAVSVVSKPCQRADTLLEVNGALVRNAKTAFIDRSAPKGQKKLRGWNVAVCGTGLFYYHEDYSIRFVEWFELLRALGISKVIFHETDIHPNISKVLSHYESQGFLEVIKFSYPEPFVNEPSIRRTWYIMEETANFYMIPMYFTDCILRHMHEYRFIAHIDPDEVPMMYKHDSYLSLMDDVLIEATKSARRIMTPSAYVMSWKYHLADLEPSEKNRDLPSYLWVLRHSFIPTEYNPFNMNFKSLYDLNYVTGVSAHKALLCNAYRCYHHRIPESYGYLGHFKEGFNCGENCKLPGSTREVPVLLKYKESVGKAVRETLQKLKLI